MSFFDWFAEEVDSTLHCIFGSDDKEPTQEERIEALEDELEDLKKKK